MTLAHDVHGDGPPVLLVHGGALDRRMWEPNMAALTEHHLVVRCDLRGFGATPPPDRPYSHAEDVLALLGVLGIERASVVGLSLGGGVALELALGHPEAVARLVLADTDLPGVPLRDAATIEAFGAVRELALAGDLGGARAAWLALPMFAHSPPDAATALAEIVGDYTLWHWLNPNPQVALDPPAGLRGSEIRAPALVVYGQHDVPDAIENCKRIGRDIPDAQITALPRAGHLSNMDAPAAFDMAVLAFLAAND